MKRPWAVLLIAAVLGGCRQSQPATNPFLRTTVAPPATGQAAVAVPTDPYYQPQGVPPVTSGAPVFPPGVPAGQPVVAPPPVIAPPSSNRYAPPGGSFQYNQSSLERSKAADREAARFAARGGPVPGQDDMNELDPVRKAVALSSEADPVTPASYRPVSNARRDPVATAQSTAIQQTMAQRPAAVEESEETLDAPTSTVRIVGSPRVNRDEDADSTDDDGPSRSTSEASVRETRRPITDSRSPATSSSQLSWRTPKP